VLYVLALGVAADGVKWDRVTQSAYAHGER
jgi:hypothetical protein